jgi:hypothetical protein
VETNQLSDLTYLKGSLASTIPFSKDMVSMTHLSASTQFLISWLKISTNKRRNLTSRYLKKREEQTRRQVSMHGISTCTEMSPSLLTFSMVNTNQHWSALYAIKSQLHLIHTCWCLFLFPKSNTYPLNSSISNITKMKNTRTINSISESRTLTEFRT